MMERGTGSGPAAGLLAAGLLLAAWLGLGAAPAAATTCAGTVSPPAGTLCGLSLPAPAGTKRPVYSYRGIPYAQPPVGDLRWAPPQPLAPWTGTLQATSFGAVCPQEEAPGRESEDCLFLNVWTPKAAVARNQRLPVMVFIHGGAFVYGAGSLPIYDGAYLAAAGEVVVVTLNYRLGSLGYLAVPELDLRGNFGIQDQRQALRWVQDNIRTFGGDPRKVTIFGESAGAMSVGLHLFSIPQNRARFRAAIMESNPLAVPYPSLAAQLEAKWTEFRDALCLEANLPPNCTFDLAGLRALPLATIEAADGDFNSLSAVLGRIQVPTAIANILPWTPIVDGQIFTTGPTLIQNQPYEGFSSGPAGTAAPKPFLIGVNRDEGALFADLVNQADSSGLTPAEYQLLLSVTFGAATATQITSFAVAGDQPYSAADQGTLPPWFANSAAAAAASTTLNDFAFRCGSFLTADRAAAAPGAKPIHAYLFAQAPIYTSDGSTACAPFPSQPSLQNACHSFELPYVFNTLAATNAATIPPANAALARRIARHWTNFARDLDPGRGWSPYRATPLPGGNRIEVLNTASAATGALAVPADPVGAANCTALWATLPPFTGSFPAN
jgi:para-nitrobenzyl esterase